MNKQHGFLRWLFAIFATVLMVVTSPAPAMAATAAPTPRNTPERTSVVGIEATTTTTTTTKTYKVGSKKLFLVEKLKKTGCKKPRKLTFKKKMAGTWETKVTATTNLSTQTTKKGAIGQLAKKYNQLARWAANYGWGLNFSTPSTKKNSAKWAQYTVTISCRWIDSEGVWWTRSYNQTPLYMVASGGKVNFWWGNNGGSAKRTTYKRVKGTLERNSVIGPWGNVGSKL